MGKKGNLGNFDRCMAAGARQDGLNISETVEVLEFSYTTKFYRELYRTLQKMFKKEKEQLSGRTYLVHARGQKRMARLL